MMVRFVYKEVITQTLADWKYIVTHSGVQYVEGLLMKMMLQLPAVSWDTVWLNQSSVLGTSSRKAQHILCNICCKQLVACNTLYTGVNGACNMLHEIGNSSISHSMLQAPLT